MSERNQKKKPTKKPAAEKKKPGRPKKKKITGEELGRMLLKDMAQVYIDPSKPIFKNPEEMDTLSKQLDTPKDRWDLEQYRILHTYIAHLIALWRAENNELYSAFITMYPTLKVLLDAEKENATVIPPVIMTQEQYNKLPSERIPEYKGGIAVLQPYTLPEQHIQEGRYNPPEPYWRRNYMADSFIEKETADDDVFTDARGRLYVAIARTYAIEATLDLYAEYVQIPELKKILPRRDMQQIYLDPLYSLMDEILNVITRHGASYPWDKDPENRIKEALRDIFKRMDIKQLQPSKRSRGVAKKIITIETADRGLTETIFNILMEDTAVRRV